MTKIAHSRGAGTLLSLLLAAAVFTAPANAQTTEPAPEAPVEQAQPQTPPTATPPTPDAQAPAEAPAPAPDAGAPASEAEAPTPETPAPEGVTPDAVPQDPAAEAAPQEPPPNFLEDPAAALSAMFDPDRRGDFQHDLSAWGMFMAADWVVKAVMIGLAFASVLTWTVWLAKSIEIAGAKTRARRALAAISDAADLAEAGRALEGRGGPGAYMVRSAQEEIYRSDAAIDHVGGAGVKERVASRLQRIEAAAGRRLTRGTGVLATIGSTAPFVGLFGTVWGIMNSFIGIAESQTTNLAVVAPGIAEALLATAIGLVAAIPAVVVYNVFARSIAGYRQLLGDAGAAVERLVSLELDFRNLPPPEGRQLAQAAE